MNLDTSGLSAMYEQALTIRSYFENAYYTIAVLTAPTSTAASYISNIQENLRVCLESEPQIYKEIKSYIDDIEAENARIMILTGQVDTDINIGYTLGNAGTAVEWGLRIGGEKIGDGWDTARAWVYDKSATLFDWLGLEDTAEAMKNARDKTMSEIEEDKANSWYYDKYNKAAYILRNAQSGLPYDGTGCQFIAGMTSYLPMRVSDLLAPGSGILLSGVAGAGKAADESLSRSKNENVSWEGIQDGYENGYISEEDYQVINTIRNMTDEQYRDVFDGYVKGEISAETLETVKYYYNMPEKWQTSENLGIATVNATGGFVSGAGQYAIDKVLDNLPDKNGLFFNSFARVTGNTATAALEVPYDAWVSSLASGTSYEYEFNYRDGIAAVKENAKKAAIMTIFGESLDYTGRGLNYLLNNLSNNRLKNVSGELNNLNTSKTQIDGGVSLAAKNTSGNNNDVELDDFDEKVRVAVDVSRQKIYAFIDKHPEIPITHSDVEDSISRMQIFRSREEFEAKYAQIVGKTVEYKEKLGGFAYKGTAYIPPDEINPITITHELNHTFGRPHFPTLMIDGGEFYSQGMDEALTEGLTLRIHDITDGGTTLYKDTVLCLGDMLTTLKTNHGYENLDTRAYYTGIGNDFAEALETVTGSNEFLIEVNKCLDIMNDPTSSKSAREAAGYSLQAMCEMLKQK